MSVAKVSVKASPNGTPTAKRYFSWERIGLILLLTATSVCFLWGLDRNGWANPYYSAAAQAGSQDWKAFFFGSFEWGNLITVDKTPLSIWVMSISVRLFGLNSWAILVPQALMGVGTTYLIYRILKRGFGAAPGLLGGAIYATTPVVFLMSRFNNPEPLMGLLMVAAVAVTLKAIDTGRSRSFAIAGLLLGLAFMAKQIQAFVVIPALCAAVLVVGRSPLPTRLYRLVIAAAGLFTTAGAWLLAVEVTPTASRPYIGGSVTNSAVELTLDYNGLARFIRIPAGVSGSRPVVREEELAPYNGGISRLFDGNFAPEIAWFLFPAISLSIILIVLHRRFSLNRTQTSIVIVGVAWFTTTFLLLCFMGSMVHTYYTYSLAAPVSIVIPIGLFSLWRLRDRLVLRVVGSILVGSSTYMSVRILYYSDEWPIWFWALVILSGVAGAVGWLCSVSIKQARLTAATVTLALLAGAIGANTYTLATPQSGTNPQSGPIANDPMAMSRLLKMARRGTPAWAEQIAYGSKPVPAVTEILLETADEHRWAAATYSAQNAALYQLATGRPIIPLGGWLGTDPAPTVSDFKAMVSNNEIGYFIWQQDLLDRGELSQETIEISNWVGSNFIGENVSGVTIYKLSSSE